MFVEPSLVDNFARADLHDASGRLVGVALLTEITSGIRIVIEVEGLAPGPKGVHFHSIGACDPPEFLSAGPHLEPDRRRHGLLNPLGPHAGDLPNITIGSDGRGRLEAFTERVTFGLGTNTLFDQDGTALLIHSAPDDFVTDPTGNTGTAIACGTVARSDLGPRPQLR